MCESTNIYFYRKNEAQRINYTEIIKVYCTYKHKRAINRDDKLDYDDDGLDDSKTIVEKYPWSLWRH